MKLHRHGSPVCQKFQLLQRKRVVISIAQKLNALEHLDKGESVQLICNELGVGKSTVNDWQRNRNSLQDYCMQVESQKVLKSHCTTRKPTNEIVDDALWVWFIQQRRKGTPISGPILKEKALCFHKKLENQAEFVASDGWLSRWKKRHGTHVLDAVSYTHLDVYKRQPYIHTGLPLANTGCIHILIITLNTHSHSAS